MTYLWKALVAISLLLNGICLLYAYAIASSISTTSNPYSQQNYEIAQIKKDLQQIRVELDESSSKQAAPDPRARK